MPDLSEKDKKKPLSRTVAVQILIFSALILISAAALRPLQLALNRGVTHIRDNIILKIEKKIGMEIKYSSIRPNIFGSFDIRNLSVINSLSNENEKNVLLSVSRLRISFSFIDLLRKNKTAIHSIQLERPVISLDMKKDSAVIEYFSSLMNGAQETKTSGENDFFSEISDFIPEKHEIKIRRFAVNIIDGDRLYQIGDFTLDIRGYENKYSLEGKLKASVKDSDFFKNPYRIAAAMDVKGEYSPQEQEGNADFLFSTVTVRDSAKLLLGLQPLRARLELKEKMLTFASADREKSYGFNLGYNVETGSFSVAVNCQDFSFGEIFSASDAWYLNSQFLSQRISGMASFSLQNSASRDSQVRYNVDFRGVNPGSKGDSFAINAGGNEKNITVNELSLSSSVLASGFFRGNLKFSGNMDLSPFKPSGIIVFDRFSISGEDDINAVMNVYNYGREIIISGEDVQIGQTAINILDMRLIPAQKNLDVSVYVLCPDEKNVNMDVTYYYNPGRVEASLAMDSFSLFDLAGLFRPFVKNINIPSFSRSYFQNTAITTEIFFTTDFNHVMYNAPRMTIEQKTEYGETAVVGIISLSGTNSQFSLTEGVFFIEDKELRFFTNVNFASLSDIGFSLGANYLNLSWRIDGQILDMSSLTIRSHDGLNAGGSISNSGAISGYVEAVDFPLPINNQTAFFNCYITLRYSSRDLWQLDVNHFNAKDLDLPGGSANAGISGLADQSGAVFNNLKFSDGISALGGSASFSWEDDFNNLRVTINMSEDASRNLSARNGSHSYDSGEFYFFNASINEGLFDFNAEVSRMRLDRFFNNNGREILASAEAKLTNDDFLINNLVMEFSDIKTFLPKVELSRTKNLIQASAEIQGFLLEKKIQGYVDFNANFKPIDSWLEISSLLYSIDGSFRTENLQYGDIKSQEPFIFVFSRSGGAFTLSGGPKNMLRLEMDRDGNFFAGLSSPLPIRSSIVGNLKDGYINASCPDLYIDLPALWAMLPPLPVFGIEGGYITGNINVRGPVGDPEFFGSARGTSFRLLVPQHIERELRPVPFNIAIEGNEMNFGPVITQVGGGMGNVSGWFNFSRWLPKSFGIDISVPRETPIPFGINITSFVARGDASGKLYLHMEDDIFNIRGDLFANNTEMGLNTDEMLQSQGTEIFADSLIPIVVNMTITSGPTVEFIWPNANFPILRASAELGTVINVSADSMNGQFSINSDVKIRSGEIFYFERNFYIRQGVLVFRENETQFNPRLSARAEIRDRTDTGPVTISMIIENEPLLTFIPRFEANPVLTQLEIYSLLGQSLGNMQGNEDPEVAQRFFLTSTTDFLAQIVVVRQFERQVRNVLNLDMFSVRTQILQNAVLNAAGLGQTPVDRNSRVGNYFDNTTVFGGKYIGQDMFIQGMVSMRYDENDLSISGLKFEPDIGVELQSPFFNIRWDFFPYHPENWWVNDNSITLTWSKSF